VPNHRMWPAARRRARRRLLREQAGLCVWCRQPFTTSEPPTLEHLKPRRHGGTNSLSNLALAHRRCNR